MTTIQSTTDHSAAEWCNAQITGITGLKRKIATNGQPYAIATARLTSTSPGRGAGVEALHRIMAFKEERIALIEAIAESGGELFGRIDGTVFLVIDHPRGSSPHVHMRRPTKSQMPANPRSSLCEMAVVIDEARVLISAKGTRYGRGTGRIGPEQERVVLKAFGEQALAVFQPGFTGQLVGERTDNEFRIACLPKLAQAA